MPFWFTLIMAGILMTIPTILIAFIVGGLFKLGKIDEQ